MSTETSDQDPHATIPLENAKYFTSDPDWVRLSTRLGYTLKTTRPLPPATHPSLPLDVASDREAQLISEGEWTTCNPLSTVSYAARTTYMPARDGHRVEVKVYRPTRVPDTATLPLLFVTHGGGWIQGSHVTEEAWLLWPVFRAFDLVVVSVAYRLAPEYRFPVFLHDCWDVLSGVLEPGCAADLGIDVGKVLLAGSSAGGCLSAVLSQMARDAGLAIAAVVLNVPITCDPREFPRDDYEFTSYDQCFATLLSSGEMMQVWETVMTDVNSSRVGEEKTVGLSPLLGDVKGLPVHVVYVAGQDPLRDEGIAYAKKLESQGVKVKLRIYPGVPHTFGEFWELETTRRWWEHVKEDLTTLLQD